MMTQISPHVPFLILLLVLHDLPSQPKGLAFPFAHYKTLTSLSYSLLTRVANARESRGDVDGAARAREIADKLRLLGGGREVWAVGWDFAWNYALSGGVSSTAEIYRAGIDLFEAMREVSSLDSSAERAGWVMRNYELVIGLLNSLFRSLLRVFSKSGPLREAILVLQKEMMEGGLLKDCIEVGARDLDGLIRVAKDMLFPVNSDDREL